MPDFDFDAELEKVTPPAEPESATPAPASTESPATPPNYAAVEALIPDAEDIDPDFRGKPIKDILRVAKQHKEEAKASYSRNQELRDLQERITRSEALLAQRLQQAGPQQPQMTREQWLEHFANNPQAVLPEEFSRYVGPLQEKLTAAESKVFKISAELARERAQRVVGVNEETWERLTPRLANILMVRNADPESPQNWVAAYNEYKEDMGLVAPQRSATPAPPPGGQARSTPGAPGLGSSKLTKAELEWAKILDPDIYKDEKNLDKLAKELGR